MCRGRGHDAQRTNLDVALHYAAADFKVFHCDAAKRPLVASWATEATKDPATIRALWAADPHALVGLPMKPHGLLVFDADRHREGEDGVAHFRALCAGHEPLPTHPIVLTANGGEHHIFRQPANKIGNRKLGNGLETRGIRTTTTADTSSRRGQDCLMAVAGGSQTAHRHCSMPHFLSRRRGWQTTPANGVRNCRRSTRIDPPESAKNPTPQRHSTIWRAISPQCPRESGRNNRLNTAALKLGGMVARGWIGRATVEGRLFDACVANALVKDTSANAVRGTVRSGFEAGLKQPHADLQNRNQEQVESARDPEPRKPHDPFAWQRGTFTAIDLQTMDFPPFAWIVQDILPAEGAALVCSRPKFGKSWIALDLCLGCAADRFILGTLKPKQGDVLYLALEDSKRRLQRRMTKLLPFGSKWPERLRLTTEWRRLHDGGLEDIRAWYDLTKGKGGNPILVVVDVLAKVRKPTKPGTPQYEADYEALTGITKLANELGIAILVVHHVRKMQADDLMEMVSGTYGITGAVDTILVMANKPNGTVLDIRGRDAEQAELAIEFEKATCRWRILGDAAEVHLSEQQSKILAALRQAGEPLGAADLEKITEIKRDTLGKALYRLANEGAIKRVGRGLYAIPEWQPPPEGPKAHSGKSGKPHRPLPDSLPKSNPHENIK